MTEDIRKYLQYHYEEILSEHWHKVLQVRELKETNKDNHPLRVKSIQDRSNELSNIIKKKTAYELLYEDWIEIPKWYEDIKEKHKIKE